MALFYKIENYVFTEFLELLVDGNKYNYTLKLEQKNYSKFLELVNVVSQKANESVIDFETMRTIIKMLLQNETQQKELLNFVEGEYLIILIKDLMENFKTKNKNFEDKKK